MIAQYLPAGSTDREIADDVENAVHDGTVGAGCRLPPVAEVAAASGAGAATVAAAYRRLRERGLLRPHGSRGTLDAGGEVGIGFQSGPLPAGARDLRDGMPAPELLPDPSPFLTELAASPTLRTDRVSDEALLELAAARFSRDGIPAEHLAIVGGGMDGVERVLSSRLEKGDSVGVEDPTYPPVAGLVVAMGLRPEPIPIDAEGITAAGFAAALEAGISAVVITPRAQNPTGAALGERRRDELFAVLRGRPELLVIEDDHMGSAAGAPAVSLAADSGVERWAVVRSVSKSLGSDLRLALVSGDEATIRRLDRRQVVGAGWVSMMLQGLVAAMWSSPEVEALTTTAAEAYRDRRRRLLEALAGHGIEASGASGINVWVPVARELPVVEHLLAAGWAVSPGDNFRLGSPPAIRVTVSRLREGEEAELAAAIARALGAAGAQASG